MGAAYVALALLGQAGIGGCLGGSIIPCDAAAYYYADRYQPVAVTPQFGYSPAFLWAFAPFRLLPFEAFVTLWTALHIAALVWLRAGWMLAVPGMNEDVIRGNVTAFVAVALVLALRHGAPWVFPLLTKVLPGVGMLWHLVRREWRQIAWAFGATAAIAAIGLLIDPQLWVEWVELLADRGGSAAGTLVPRLVLAAGIVVTAGLTSRAWMVPIGMIVGWSAISPPVFMMLAAIPRLIRDPDTARSPAP